MSKQELLDKIKARGEIMRPHADKITAEERTEFYALRDQFQNGDNTTEKPTTGEADLAKWEAWNTKKGLTDEQAYEKLTKFQNELISKYTK